jgi:transposase
VSSVASTLDTVSVRAMVEALIAGERDPEVLAGLAKGRMRAKHAALVEALAGRFDDHHAELARMLWDQIDALGAQVATLTARIEQLLAAIPAAQGVDADGGTGRVPAWQRTRRCCPPWRGWMRSPASGGTPRR